MELRSLSQTWVWTSSTRRSSRSIERPRWRIWPQSLSLSSRSLTDSWSMEILAVLRQSIHSFDLWSGHKRIVRFSCRVPSGRICSLPTSSRIQRSANDLFRMGWSICKRSSSRWVKEEGTFQSSRIFIFEASTRSVLTLSFSYSFSFSFIFYLSFSSSSFLLL